MKIKLPPRRMTVRLCKDGKMRGGFAKRTLEEDIVAFHARVKRGEPDECWPWQGSAVPMGNKTGGKYGKMTFMGKPTPTHRVAFMIARNLEPIPVGLVIRHNPCNFGLCCNPKHLMLGTSQDNAADAKRDGLFATGDRSGSRTHPESRPRGENHPRAKSTQKNVLRMFKLRFQGVEERKIAKAMGITAATVSRTLSRKVWKHIEIPTRYLNFDAKKLHRANNGKAHRRHTDANIIRARALYDAGTSVAEITRVIPGSYSQIRKIVLCLVHQDVK